MLGLLKGSIRAIPHSGIGPSHGARVVPTVHATVPRNSKTVMRVTHPARSRTRVGCVCYLEQPLCQKVVCCFSPGKGAAPLIGRAIATHLRERRGGGVGVVRTFGALRFERRASC